MRPRGPGEAVWSALVWLMWEEMKQIEVNDVSDAEHNEDWSGEKCRL